MKANRRTAPLFVLAVATLATLTASCSERIIPPPTPAPTPRPTSQPPQPSRPVAQDWRNAPITPGDWSWSQEGGQSVARFAGGLLVLRCDRAAGTITLLRAAPINQTTAPARSEPMTVTTTSGNRTLSAAPAERALAVTLTPRDPLLDMMIFSRGRFVIETPGAAPLYVPSWPEVSRVTEDCR